MIQLQDLFFQKFISKAEVKGAVNNVSLKINKDYKEKSPVFLIVLNGAFLFVYFQHHRDLLCNVF